MANKPRGIRRAVALCPVKRKRRKKSQSRCRDSEVTGAAAAAEEGKAQ